MVPPLIPEVFEKGIPVADQCVEGNPRRPSFTNPFGLPAPLTGRQLLYIIVPQCIGAAVIDGGINFGIACGMYRKQSNITMWILKHNTIAGDLGVTVFIQGILTYIIVTNMVRLDMRKKAIDAFPYPWPDQAFGVVRLRDLAPGTVPSKWERKWRKFHERHGLGRGICVFSGTASSNLLDFSITWREFFVRLWWNAFTGAALSLLFFLVFWPIAIAATAPRWGGRNMAGSWAPEIIKLVFAFIFGMIQNPLVACLTLGSEDAVRDHRREVHRQQVDAIEEARPAPNTDAERVVSLGAASGLREMDRVYLP